MPNPSTTQVVEIRGEIALANEARGITATVCGHWSCFADVVAISVGRGLSWMQTRFGLQENLPIIGASNVNCLSCKY